MRRKFEIFLRPRVYIGGERSEFFQVPEPRRKFRSFLSPRAFIEREVRNFMTTRAYMKETVRRMASRALLGVSPTGGIRRRRKLGMFPSPRAYIQGGDRNVSKAQENEEI